MASISAFKNKIYQGVARPNRFEVTISVPSFPGFSLFGRAITVLCDAASLPTSAIATQEDTMWGPNRKMPYNKTYDDLRLSFICTPSMNERAFFDAWQNIVINRDGFTVGYYSDYIGNITITTLDESDIPTYSIMCMECYPLSVNAQELSSAETDTYMRLDVNLAYRYWTLA